MNSDFAMYKDLYVKSSREYIVSLRTNLEKLSQNPDNKEILYEVFRLFHSLKSQNFFMGFKQNSDFCKQLESFFANLKENNLPYDKSKSGVILTAIDWIGRSIDSIEKRNEEITIPRDLLFSLSPK